MPLRSRVGRAGARALPLVGCACLALAWTWPLALHLGDRVVTASWWYDALLNAAQLETFSSNLLHRPAELLAGYQFFPHPDVLSFTEQMPAIAVVARVFRLAGASPIGAYNLVLLLGLALDGWAAFLLVRAVTGEAALGALAAVALEATPYLVYELGRVQLVWCWPWLAALACMHRLAVSERARPATIGLALAVALGWGSCVYYAVLTTPLLVVAALVYAASGAVARRRAFLARAALALAAGTAPLLPGLLAYRSVSATYGFGRSVWNVAPADPATYLRLTPGRWAVWGSALALPTGAAERVLFPGVVVLALLAAAIACWAAVRTRRAAAWVSALRRARLGRPSAMLALVPVWVAAAIAAFSLRDLSPLLVAGLLSCLWPRRPGATDAPGAAVRVLAVVAVAAFAFSLGRSIRLGGTELTLPLRWVFDVLPGFHAVRLVSRWGVVAIGACVGMVAIAGAGVPARRRLVRVGVPAVLALAALVELRPRPLPLMPLAPRVDERPGFRYLRDHPGGALAALPVRGTVKRPADGVAEDAVLTFAAACFHHHPTVNGMSGFDPPFYRDVVLPVLASFPDVESLRLLDALGVRWIFFRGDLAEAAQRAAVEASAAAHPELVRVALREGSDLVLERVGAPAPRWPAAPLPASASLAPLPPGCTATASSPGGAETALEGSAGAHGWVSVGPQRGGESVAVECREPIAAAGFWLALGGRFAAYPRGISIEARAGDGTWRRVLVEDDAIDLDRLVLHPLRDRVVKRFPPARAGSWRIVQTGASARDPWAVAGIGVVRAEP